jgi:23S rRNA (uracil1939-C5)-methyltransferase
LRRTRQWAVDLYAGVGLFSVKLAERFGKVTAVESGGSAFRDLTHNFRNRRECQCRRLSGGFDKRPISSWPIRRAPVWAKVVVKELARIRAPRLTIVSCDPATLARDLQGLLAENYRIDKITLVDLFPQTFHLETVVELSA